VYIAFLVEHMSDYKRTFAFFKQEITHWLTPEVIMCNIYSIFGDRVISMELWPTHSPDLKWSDFYMWGQSKIEADGTNLCSKELGK
jgi:hypothetical protein